MEPGLGLVQEMGGYLSGRRMLEAIGIEIVLALICLLSNLQLIWLDLPPACKVLIPGISGNICSLKKCECISQAGWSKCPDHLAIIIFIVHNIKVL